MAVILGVATATAVLTGALLVGDSMRGSLRDLALDRLGKTSDLLVADRFFPAARAADLARTPEFQAAFSLAEPAIVMEGSLSLATGGVVSGGGARAGRVQILAVRPEFFALGEGLPPFPLGANQIAVNAALAAELGLSASGSSASDSSATEASATEYRPPASPAPDVIFRLAVAGGDPRRQFAGKKERHAPHAAIDRERDSAQPQHRPIFTQPGISRQGFTAFVPLPLVQQMLEKKGSANAIFVAPLGTAPADSAQRLDKAFGATLADLGYQVRVTQRGYLDFASGRMILEPAVRKAAERDLAALRPAGTMTYMANADSGSVRQVGSLCHHRRPGLRRRAAAGSVFEARRPACCAARRR